LIKATASLLAMLLGGMALFWCLGAGAGYLPFSARNVFLLAAWLGIPLLSIVSAFTGWRSGRSSRLEKAGGAARLVFGLVGLAAFGLLTDVGILLGGHRYWIERGLSAATDAEARRCLNVVLRSTQYGRDILAGEWERLPAGERRRRLALVLEPSPGGSFSDGHKKVEAEAGEPLRPRHRYRGGMTGRKEESGRQDEGLVSP